MRYVLLLIGAVIVLTGVACDPSHRVRIINSNDEPILVREDASSRGNLQRIEARGDLVLNWLIDPSARDETPLREVRATTLSGESVYCRKLTYGDLRATNWTLTIRIGELRC